MAGAFTFWLSLDILLALKHFGLRLDFLARLKTPRLALECLGSRLYILACALTFWLGLGYFGSVLDVLSHTQNKAGYMAEQSRAIGQE